MNYVQQIINMRFLSCIILLLFIACNVKINETENRYFLAAFNQKIKELESNKYKLHQFIIKDEKQDTLLIDSVEWKKELALFFDNALTEKKAINYRKIGKSSKDLVNVEYNLIDDSEDLKKVSYVLKQDSSFIYNAHIIKKNRLSEITYYIEFDSSKGYLIKGFQKVPYSHETEFRIEVYFIP